VIHDADIVTVFTIEALGLVDHFSFLDKFATGGKGSTAPKRKQTTPEVTEPPASLKQAAISAGWFLSTTDKWTKPYFNPKDLKFADRILFG